MSDKDRFIEALKAEDLNEAIALLSNGKTALLIVEAKLEGFGNYLYETVRPAIKNAGICVTIERFCKPTNFLSHF